jgi:type III secretion protein J
MRTDASCKKSSMVALKLFLFFCLALLFSGCSSQKAIISGVEERDANEILVLLASKGISAYKIKEKSEAGGGGGPVLWDIAVDSDKADQAMALLTANGLPHRHTEKLLQLFTSSGLVPSEMQEKIRYQAGLAEQIAGTIRKIDGVLDADVQLSFPEEDPLNPGKTRGAVTASVYVKHNGVLDDPNSHLVTKIRRLVAASVQGLNFDNVTVVGEKVRFPSVTPAEERPGGGEMVKVWGVIVAKTAVGKFQTLFFTLSALLALFILLTLWLVWKVLPVARHAGGVTTIFSLHPFELEEVTKTSEEEGKPKEPPKTPPAAGGPKVQENVEST